MTAISRSIPFAIALVLGLSWAGVTHAQQGKTTTPPETPKDQAPPADQEKPKDDAAKGKEKEKAKEKPKSELATFGGGCFWCQEAVFERIPGVKAVVSGYSGGAVADPTYQMVCTGLTGHAEVIQIEFDPSVVTFDKLLNVFFHAHDPTTLNSQGPDHGTQYRSIILYHSDAQKKEAEAMYKDLTKRRAFRDPIVTELVPFKTFYPAEDYHQNYYRGHRYEDYSQSEIAPKLRKLKAKQLIK